MNLAATGTELLEKVPIFPLGTVLYPGMRLPLRIFETRYMDMAKACLKQGSAFGVCLIREGEEVGTPAVPEAVGCLARIAQWDMPTLGILEVKAEGLERFRLKATRTATSGLIEGDIERMPAEQAIEAPELAQGAAFVRRVVAALGPSHFAEPHRYGDASWVGFRLAEILPLGNAEKQKLLELTDAAVRLEILHRFLREQHLLG